MSWAKRKPKTSKWGGGPFNALPRQFTESRALQNLGPYACKLFLDLQAQYTGFNNGDLSIAWLTMQKRGWHSKATLAKAANELLEVGVILRTRQGHRRQCHLYALTLYDIDECKGKLDVRPTCVPPRSWLLHEPVKPIAQLQAECRANQMKRAQNTA